MRIVRRAAVVGTALLVLAACAPRFESGATLQVTAASGGILISWPTAVEYDAGQTIAQYRVDVDGVEVARVPSTVRSCQLTKVPTGSHTVKVTAYDSNGEWSGTVDPAGTLSAQVTGPTLDAADAVVGCGGYGLTDPTAAQAAWATITAALPAHGSTANAATCSPGTTSSIYRAAALAKINAFRTLSGVAATAEDSTYTAQAQNTALLMAANGDINHFPPTSWACYTADGAAGAASSNLGYAGSSVPFTTTVDGITQYMVDDGASNLPTGHRRWTLCPGTTKVGFGKAQNFVSPWHYQMDALKVMPASGYPAGQSRDGIIAWPNPGVVPLASASSTGLLARFSVMVPSGRSVANASVAISSSNGVAVSVVDVVKSTDLYCSQAVTFAPSRAPGAGETWTFTVSGLRNADTSSYTEMWTTTFTGP